MPSALRSPELLVIASLSLLFSPNLHSQSLVYWQMDPPVIVPSSTSTLSLQVKVGGSPHRITFESALQPGVELNMQSDGAGDGIYSVTLPAAPVVAAMRADDVYRPLLGYFRAYNGTTNTGRYNAVAEVADAAIPRLPVTVDAADAQHTDYIVNLLAPSAFPTNIAPTVIPDQAAIAKRFFQLFPDVFDVINIVYVPSFFQNRYHYAVRNAVQGLGMAILDNGAAYGSTSHLLGISVFPAPSFFDGADAGVQHEFGHQWINFLNVPPVGHQNSTWPRNEHLANNGATRYRIG